MSELLAAGQCSKSVVTAWSQGDTPGLQGMSTDRHMLLPSERGVPQREGCWCCVIESQCGQMLCKREVVGSQKLHMSGWEEIVV